MLVPVNNLGEFGIIVDRKPHELPLNAWSDGKNVRFRSGFVEKFLGHGSVFGTPTIGSYLLLPATLGSAYYWLQCGLAKVHVWDGISHTNITRQTAAVDVNYNATALQGWTGCIVGGVPVINNGIDLPQQWSPVSVATKLVALANWNVNHIANSLREFRRHLVAFDVTKSGTRHPHMVKWSHPADSGAVPSSWDETDDTKDAGEYNILGGLGYVVDGISLRDLMIVYKEDSVHAMQYVGGTQIFRFHKLFDSFGILAKKCAVEFSAGKHAVFARGDLIVHDGQSWDSIVNRRMRDWLFNQLDSVNYVTSFVIANPDKYEVWFCFTASGDSLPTRALVWNWKDNAIGVRDLNSFSHIALGNPIASVGAWDSDSEAWDSDPSTWDSAPSASSPRLIAARPGVPEILQLDLSQVFSGTPFNSYVERTGIAFPVRPEGPPDLQSMRFMTELWPRIEGTLGASVQIEVGSQNEIGGSVSWQAPRNYVIGSTKMLDVRLSGRLFAIRASSNANLDWRFHGYEALVKKLGSF